jgi:predicted nucleic acid-binding protein
MIVVDTSVWIDVLNDIDSPKGQRCTDLLKDGAPLALTDVIFTEILQGFRHERDAQRVEKHLRAFPVIRLQDLDDFALAAKLYRKARRAGITIRKTLDCLIAAPCVRNGIPILHADEDFDRLASCTDLEVFS